MSQQGQKDMISALKKDEEGGTFLGGARKKVSSRRRRTRGAGKSSRKEIVNDKGNGGVESREQVTTLNDRKQQFIEECKQNLGMTLKAVQSESDADNVAGCSDKEKVSAVDSYINWRLSLIDLDQLEKRRVMKQEQEDLLGKDDIYQQKPVNFIGTDVSLEEEKDFQVKNNGDFTGKVEEFEDNEENAVGFSFQDFSKNLPSYDLCPIQHDGFPIERNERNHRGRKNKSEGKFLKHYEYGGLLDGYIYSAPQHCQDINLKDPSQDITWRQALNSVNRLQELVQQQEKAIQHAIHVHECEETMMKGRKSSLVKEDVSKSEDLNISKAFLSEITEETEHGGSHFCSIGMENDEENIPQVHFPQFYFPSKLIIDFEEIEKFIMNQTQTKDNSQVQDTEALQGSLSETSGMEKGEENSLVKYDIQVNMENVNSPSEEEKKIEPNTTVTGKEMGEED